MLPPLFMLPFLCSPGNKVGVELKCETIGWCFGWRGGGDSEENQSVMSQCRKNSVRGQVIDKWFIRLGTLVRLIGRRARGCHLENLLGYRFIIRGKVGRGKRPSLLFLNGRHASVISSSSRLGREVFLFLCGKARSANYCFLLICVQRACLDLLSSPSRMWVSYYHCFIVWGMSLASLALFCCQTSLLDFVVKHTCFPE